MSARRSSGANVIVVVILAAFVLGVGWTLAQPVWQCETRIAPGDLAVVTRDCRSVPRSRAIWTWLRSL